MKSSNTVVPVIDTITGPLLKYNVNTLAPVLTGIVNSSIETSLVPCVMKHAVVTPLLKKTGLDPPPHFEFEFRVEATREARGHSGAIALGSECPI